MSSKKGKDRGKPVADQPAGGAAVPGAGDEGGGAVAAVQPDAADAADEAAATLVSPGETVADDAARHAEPVPPAAAPAEPAGAEETAVSADDSEHRCPVCDEPFKAGDTCATDIELGCCHAACLEGSPTVNLDTGDPVDGPIPTYPYEAIEGGDIGQATETGGEGGADTAAPWGGYPDAMEDGNVDGGGDLRADPRAEWPLDAGIPSDNDTTVLDPEAGDAGSADPAGGSGGSADDVDLDDVLTGFGIADMARCAAATARLYAAKGQAVRFEDVFTVDDAQIMAEFVRDNPEAPVDAMAIHLGLKKRAPRGELSAVDRFALKLFHHAVTAAIAFDKEVEAARKAAEPPPPAGRYPGRRSFMPEPAPFSPTGFRPVR